MPVLKSLLRFLRRDDGPTAVEYAVMLALILVMCIGAISSVGGASGGMWGNTRDELSAHGF
jgi:pilus assembly protein Flp/PilA